MIGNWDSYGYERGKNMYAYKPTEGPWKLVLWDLDLVLGKDSRGTSDPLLSTANSEPVVLRMYQHPPFVREFWCAMSELANTWMLPENYSALVDARYAAFRANDVPVDTPVAMKNWIAARRGFILTQIPTASFTVTTTNFLQATNNYITLSGSAPVTARGILVNGGVYPITWVSPLAWTLRVPVGAGTNTLVVTALDANGNSLGSRTNIVVFNGSVPDPKGSVVMNEIMFNPPTEQTSFLELLNTHGSFTFDLSGWRVNGLGYTFPPGAVIGPRSFVVVARNRSEYAKFYGATIPAFDQFAGALDNDGETLTLVRPGPSPGEETVVDKVRYEARAPWPAAAAGGGASLQLIDPAQDTARVSNWSDGNGWRLFTYTNSMGAGGTRLSLFFDAVGGDIYLDDIWFAAGTVAEAGVNVLANASFESDLSPSWVVGPLASNTTVVEGLAHSGNRSLHLVVAPGALSLTTFYQDFPAVAQNAQYVLSFWWRPGNAGVSFQTRLNGTYRSGLNPSQPSRYTPAAPNAVQLSLPAYPLVWLNEVMTLNTTGLADGQGEREPWIELYNSGVSPIALDGFFLTDDYVNLTRWPFPPGATIDPGQFRVVYADGEPAETAASEWHTSFRLTNGTSSVALTRLVNGAPQIVDYFNVDNLPANRSYGSCPDGQLFDRQEMFYATPGTTNNCSAAPLVVYINEWMAANTGFIRDPADNDADDWFELYNPNLFSVDLGGYFLTDNLSNQFQYPIPDNGHYVIPPLGYLLVWADGETGQNSTNRPDLHVNFQLRQAGEAIALFAADGTLIDAVTFGQQTNNISQGHYPAGTGPIYFMGMPTPRVANRDPNPATLPEFVSISIVNGSGPSFTIRTIAGRTYRIEYSDNLTPGSWTQLTPDRSATGSTLVIQDPFNERSQRFYRVTLLP